MTANEVLQEKIKHIENDVTDIKRDVAEIKDVDSYIAETA